jgi:hypothetical protein
MKEEVEDEFKEEDEWEGEEGVVRRRRDGGIY